MKKKRFCLTSIIFANRFLITYKVRIKKFLILSKKKILLSKLALYATSDVIYIII